MERAVEAGLEVAQQRVDPAELRQVAGVLPPGDDGLMAAARRGDGTEAGHAIGEHQRPAVTQLRAHNQRRGELRETGPTRLSKLA